MSLVGKRYTPGDNSYIVNIKNKYSDQHISLFDLETIIISEPYEERVTSCFVKGGYMRTFVNVLYNGEIYRVLYNPGWINEEDIDNKGVFVFIGGKTYLVIEIN